MPKILIVDDNRTIRRLLLKELTQDNLQVITLETIELFWEFIRTHQLDLVLLGLHSESFDCWQILNDIKKTYPDLPVLIYIVKSNHSINSLKLAIEEVLRNGSISSAFMFHALKRPNSGKVQVK